MEMEVVDLTIDDVARPVPETSRRRTSIFRPEKDCYGDDLEVQYPEWYKQKLEKEKSDWQKTFNLAWREYTATKSQMKQSKLMKLDKTLLDKHQLEFLEQGPTCEHYLKAVQEFSNQLQLCKGLSEIRAKAKQQEKDRLLSEIGFQRKLLLETLRGEE